MKKYVLLILLIMQGGILYCQNYTLPSVLFDSMAFEVRKGRSCDSLQVLNERLIESQGVQLMNYDKALKLSESKSSTLESLLSNSKEQGRVDKMQHDLNEKVLKQKVRKRNGIILIETIGIIGIILLL